MNAHTLYLQLKKFRTKFKAETEDYYKDLIQGKELYPDKNRRVLNDISKSKLVLAKDLMKYLLVSNIPIFIGVTGSVASGIAKKEDDIDIFVVVPEHLLWIYRFLLVVNLKRYSLYRETITSRDLNIFQEDTLCINTFYTPKSINVKDSDMFIINEIMQMIPIYNCCYWYELWKGSVGYILDSESRRELKVDSLDSKKSVSEDILNNKFLRLPLRFINFIIFISWSIYMYLLHKYSISRSIKNFREGKIELFPSNSREYFSTSS